MKLKSRKEGGMEDRQRERKKREREREREGGREKYYVRRKLGALSQTPKML